MRGGPMRTAAKSTVLGGYRTAADAVTAARRASGSLNATVSAVPPVDGLSLVNAPSCENDRTDMEVVSDFQRPASEIDEWIFAGEEEKLHDPTCPAARPLFGPVPTLEKAKAATAELEEAFEKVYFSSSYASDSTVRDSEVSLQSPVCLKSPVCSECSTSDSTVGDSEVSLQGPVCLESPVCSEGSVIKGCTMNENSAISSTPNRVIQMFSWLQGNTKIQNNVASIASDENVWNAVMSNPKVREFYRTQQFRAFPTETLVKPINSSESSEAHSLQDSTRFTDFIQNFKLKVLRMVENLLVFFRDYMGISTGGHSAMSTEAHDPHHSIPHAAVLLESLVALAIVTILVILLMRWPSLSLALFSFF